MPRRGGGGRPAMSQKPPSRGFMSMARPAPAAPRAVTAPAPAAGVAQQRQPGLMAQMAATAGGVAIGSAVGHTIGHAMTSGGGGSNEQQPMEQQHAPQQQAGEGPCAMEMKNFIECSQTQHDITLCQGFNDMLKQCRVQYGY